MNINLSFLLTALAIFINFSFVQTRTEFFTPEVSIETEAETHSNVLPDFITPDIEIDVVPPQKLIAVIYVESSLLISPEFIAVDPEKFYTTFPSDIPPPLSV